MRGVVVVMFAALSGCGRIDFASTRTSENTAPIVLGIESHVGIAEYRRKVIVTDVAPYFVRFTDPDPDQSHATTWTVDAIEVTPPIDWSRFGVGIHEIFVAVDDGIDETVAGPYEVTVTAPTGGIVTFGASGTQYTQSTMIDALGAVYTAGYFLGRIGLDPSGGVTDDQASGIWLSKLDVDQKLVYARTWPMQGQIPSIALDDVQDVVFAGSFTGTIDLDPGPGVDRHVAPAAYGGMLVKLDRAGGYLWGRAWTSDTTFSLFDVALDAEGAVYAIGMMQGTGDLDPGPGVQMHTSTMYDAVVIKLDASGSFVWARTLGAGGATYGHHVAIGADGSVICVGSFDGTVDLDPGPSIASHTSAGLTDGFVVVLDRAGGYVWSQTWGGDSWETPNDVAVGKDGSIYVTGGFASTSVAFPGGPTFTNRGQYDVFLGQIGASGFVWVQQIGDVGHDVGWALWPDPQSGDVFAAGHFSGTVDLDPGPGVEPHIAPSAEVAAWVLRLDASGGRRWASSFGGTGATAPSAIARGSWLYVTGGYTGTADFDPGAGTSSRTGDAGYDSFINMLVPSTGQWTP